jgi:hypothetical protein
MLVAESICSRLAQHYFCLDLLQAVFEDPAHPNSPKEVAATLLEVWEAGGLVQTDAEVSMGCAVSLASPGNAAALARVKSCVRDDYGYLIEFALESGQPWFPGAYRPPYLLPVPLAKD